MCHYSEKCGSDRNVAEEEEVGGHLENTKTTGPEGTIIGADTRRIYPHKPCVWQTPSYFCLCCTNPSCYSLLTLTCRFFIPT